MSDVIYTPVFRVSFPSVFKAKEQKDPNKKAQFELTMIFSKDTADKTKALGLPGSLAEVKAVVEAAAVSEWGDKLKVEAFRDSVKWPIGDGAKKVKVETGEPVNGYGPGTFYAGASSNYQPGVVDSKNQPMFDDGTFYAGCYARATLTVKAGEFKDPVKNMTIRYVKLYLQNVQKVAEGEKLSGGSTVKAEDAFKPIVSNDLNLDDL